MSGPNLVLKLSRTILGRVVRSQLVQFVNCLTYSKNLLSSFEIDEIVPVRGDDPALQINLDPKDNEPPLGLGILQYHLRRLLQDASIRVPKTRSVGIMTRFGVVSVTAPAMYVLVSGRVAMFDSFSLKPTTLVIARNGLPPFPLLFELELRGCGSEPEHAAGVS